MVRYLLSRSRVVGLCLGAAVLLTVAAKSWALGLGEIELKSSLNEEFKATIELLDPSGLAPAEILVSLASSDDFDRVGVERFFFLTDLRFEVDYGPHGNAQVTVSSSRPVTEPYLNFLVQIRWPSGRLLKEYTVLLDPPTFSEAPPPQVSAPVEQRNTAPSSGRVQREVAPAPAATGTRVQLAAPLPAPLSPEDPMAGADGRHMTDRNDTLWSIASRNRASNNVSVQQTMLAMQRMNPEAFINGNINLLKAGYSLRFPGEAETLTVSRIDALQMVARHDDAWRTGEAQVQPGQPAPLRTVADETSNLRSPVDATNSTPVQRESGPDGELRIVAAQGNTAVGGNSAAAESLLAVSEENDRLSRAVDELNYQIDRDNEISTNQIAVRDRQLEVKDQRIVELQSQLADLQLQPTQTPQQEPAAAATEQNQNQSAATELAWWESPFVLWGAAGVLVLVLAVVMLAARRRAGSTEELFEEVETFDEDFDDLNADELAVAAGNVEDYDDDTIRAVKDDADDDLDHDDEEVPGSETSDVIGEADIYIAYGRFPQAIGLLLAAIEEEPERNDVRLKLLELYSETNDREAFTEHVEALKAYCVEETTLTAARNLESEFGESALTLDQVLAEDSEAPIVDVAVEADTADSVVEDDTAPAGAEADAADLVVETDTPEMAAEADTVELAAEVDAVGVAAQADGAGEDAEFAEAASTQELPAVADGELEVEVEMEVEEVNDAFELELDDMNVETEGAPDADAQDKLGGDLGLEFNEPELPAADAEFDLESVGLSPDMEAPATADGGSTRAFAEEEFDTDVALADEDEFDFQDEGDSANTKLDLARAYIDMGDADGARDILKEVVDEGNSEQQQQAQAMLESL